jgi:acetylornithine deacetylase/succinyl-diaminopimelate desuccinylase-like protein
MKHHALVPFVVLCMAASRSVLPQAGASPAVLLEQAAVKGAVEFARSDEARTLADQIRFCEVPAPPFMEQARGEVLRGEFAALGLQNVRVDREGNVLADRPGASPRPRLVVASHLDTVFPAETDVQVRRDGAILRGPGIADNCRGLAVLVAIARAMRQHKVQTPGTVTFVANVGEEGLGDLRGMKALFGETMKGQIDRFVSIDGAGVDGATVAVGSYRYRVAFKGPGGHSFGAFGLPNPAHALGRAVAKISEFQVPSNPRTTFNVGRIGGGTSVNAIPFEAWMEVDLRSSDPTSLNALDARFHAAVDEAVAQENARWGRAGVITALKQRVGTRPAGSTPDSAPIVQIARAAGAALGLPLPLGEGSTDANVPMSLNIPAITIGGGGRATGGHALNETFDTTDSWKGTQYALLLTIALAQ